LVELAADHIVSTTLYNGQFPGPLLRFKEGQQVIIDIHNDTDTPELVHWHGQMIPGDVDGAAEEGSPFVPAHGMRRIWFVPRPSGFRFYHTHIAAGGDLNRGTYTGQADREGRRRAVDPQRRSFFDGHDETDLHGASGAPLPAQIPQRQRRHSPPAPAPAQFRIDAHRRQTDRWRDQGPGHAGGFQELEFDFVADNPGPTLFHCHQQLHMDFGFMALLQYA